MNTTAIKQVNNKLKSLPDSLVEELEQFIDYLSFRHSLEKETADVPKWQQDLVLDRANNPQKPVDALQMLQEFEEEI
ncbi:MAG: hypothetical protein C4K58_08025 [Flavobacteriaceae bacterium]|nr:MAG: hypothetical protein C4K58_08025 [Flavobacteriaceae bacterium]